MSLHMEIPIYHEIEISKMNDAKFYQWFVFIKEKHKTQKNNECNKDAITILNMMKSKSTMHQIQM